MSGTDEEWVKAAMTDDTMVVELLVRLHHAPPRPPLLKRATLPLGWSVHQRRSSSVSVNSQKKPSHRASPTTPLSWSGATSFSGGSAGPDSEESSRPIPLKLSNATRSKVNVDGEKTTSKRSKKKTLAELKEEENLLLKERRELKREMKALRVHLEGQRARNQKLKKMKIDLQPRLASETSAAEKSVSGKPPQDLRASACHPVTTSLMAPFVLGYDDVLQSSASNACADDADASSGSKFILPDLNIPFDVPSSDVICGVS